MHMPLAKCFKCVCLQLVMGVSLAALSSSEFAGGWVAGGSSCLVKMGGGSGLASLSSKGPFGSRLRPKFIDLAMTGIGLIKEGMDLIMSTLLSNIPSSSGLLIII